MRLKSRPLLKRQEVRRGPKSDLSNSPAVKVKKQDAFDFLADLQPASVDLIVSSPPYCMDKAYETSVNIVDFVSMHERLAPLLMRALSDGGSLCWQVGHSPYFLDAFLEIQLSRKKGLIENRYDMKLHRLSGRLTHSVLWGLTERLINTTTFSTELSMLKAELRKVDWQSFSKFRNLLMYDGSFWTKLENYDDCDLINLVSDVSIYRASSGEKNYEHLPFGREYFYVVDLFKSVLSLLLGDLANQLPALRGEVESVRMLEA
jgi:hypothetical protein